MTFLHTTISNVLQRMVQKKEKIKCAVCGLKCLVDVKKIRQDWADWFEMTKGQQILKI